MLYFKHSELVNKYHVSLKTVHNWIDAAKQGKLNLELYEKGSRTYIANKPSNIETVEKLVEQGKKYRNARFHKTVTPKPEFYDIFSRRQILDIITNLGVHGELPRQYNYFKDGAHNWDKWVERLSSEESPNNLKSTIGLIKTNLPSIDRLLESKGMVNVIDIGVGNALPVKELLQHLLLNGRLHRYIAIDISQEMLDIAEANIKKWFGDAIDFEGYVRDISYERFDDLLVDDKLSTQADEITNIALLLGGTPVNFRNYQDVIKVIYGSIGKDDLFVYSGKADTEATRQYFDFHPTPSGDADGLSPNHRYLVEMLNIDKSLYDVEMGYDSEHRMRYVRIKLRTPITVSFRFKGGSAREVLFDKGSTILLLRVWHMTALEILDIHQKSGFVMLQSSMTKEHNYILNIYTVDVKNVRGPLGSSKF